MGALELSVERLRGESLQTEIDEGENRVDVPGKAIYFFLFKRAGMERWSFSILLPRLDVCTLRWRLVVLRPSTNRIYDWRAVCVDIDSQNTRNDASSSGE